MTENSTPVENTPVTDTSNAEPVVKENLTADTSDANEPVGANTAENEEKDDNQEAKDNLILGKFKSQDDLVKSYKELERKLPQLSEYEKRLKTYEEQESKARMEREMQARQQGFGTIEEQQIAKDVALHEFNLFAQALESGYVKDFEEAKNALQKYYTTGNPKDLDEAKGLFTPQALELIAEQRKAFKDQKNAEYHSQQMNSQFQTAKQKLEDFAKETGEWLEPKSRQEAVAMIFKSFGADADLSGTKALIDKIEAEAIERYVKGEKAKQEQEALTSQMQAPQGIASVASGDKWFTKAQYDKLTDAEMTKHHNKIAKQIMLEKEGKLPKQITK